MANVNSDIPLINVPVVNANGMVNEAWLLFFIQLWRRTGGGTGNTPAEYFSNPTETYGNAPVDFTGQVFGNELQMAVAQLPDVLQEMVFAPASNTGFAEAISTITVGASPFAYQVSKNSAVQITGGTISALTLKRGSVTLPINVLSGGIIELTTGDILTVTYSAAPTMNLIPR